MPMPQCLAPLALVSVKHEYFFPDMLPFRPAVKLCLLPCRDQLDQLVQAKLGYRQSDHPPKSGSRFPLVAPGYHLRGKEKTSEPMNPSSLEVVIGSDV